MGSNEFIGVVKIMKFFCISDVHIKVPGDFSEKLLWAFFDDINPSKGDRIMLLGDIFDLMVGDHQEYSKKFEKTFHRIENLLKKGIEIYYFEGNHDFHIGKFLSREFSKFGHFQYSKNHTLFNVYNRKLFFSHGDDIEIENSSYKIFKKLINNTLTEFLAEKIVPFAAVEFIGKRASRASRERNIKRYETNDQVDIKDRFRRSFEVAVEKFQIDWLICGHSHVQDDFISNGRRYLNNGYAPVTKTYLEINEAGAHFHEIFLKGP